MTIRELLLSSSARIWGPFCPRDEETHVDFSVFSVPLIELGLLLIE